MPREEWIKTVGKGLVCAEVGVQNGTFSEKIYRAVKPKILYMIDCWRTIDQKEGDVIPYDNAHYQKIMLYRAVERFKEQIQTGVVRPIIDMSLDAVKRFEDNHLDFVYIDAFHTFEACYSDIVAWTPKVKSGGIVSGHDYHVNGPWGKCGVPEAVDKYVEENNIRLHLLDDRPIKAKKRWWPSKTWWFRKP